MKLFVLHSMALLTLPLLQGCEQQPIQNRDMNQGQDAFTDITLAAGIDSSHLPGQSGDFFFPDAAGSGGAFLDYDNDGDLDVYLVQPSGQDAAHSTLVNRLYRQDENGAFKEVTDVSGLDDPGYGTGVAVGDVDNDGFVDVYLSNYGPDTLYRNRGDGTFEDISSEANISGDGWSTSAAFCDYDDDGYLDIYVTSYVEYNPAVKCFGQDGTHEYCGPQSFPGEADVLYRNSGDGRFRNVSTSSGIRRVEAPGLGVVCQDFSGDGLPDFYVANDGEANQLWVNQGDGTFSEQSILLGTALNGQGETEAGMGLAVGDIDGDEDLDLFVTHLTDETNTLYLNEGMMGFRDGTAHAGLGQPGLAVTGFGTSLIDFDHDGDLDLAVANGAKAPPVFLDTD